MSSKHRTYSTEFKTEAVDLAEKIGLSKAAKDLGICSGNIRRWQTSLLNGRSTFSGSKLEELEKELRRVKKENAHLRHIGDVLKKSLGIVASDKL